MPRQYSQEQLEKIYEKLPEELKEALFSFETTQEIGDVGDTYGVIDERLNKISEYVGYVLMGLMLPQEFAGVLKKEVGLPKVLAEAISRDLNRLIFYPVKPTLEQLHTTEIAIASKTSTPKPSPLKTEQPKSQEEPSGQDIYREPVE